MGRTSVSKTRSKNRETLVQSRNRRRQRRQSSDRPRSRPSQAEDTDAIARLWDVPVNHHNTEADLTYEDMLAIGEIIGEVKSPGLSLAEAELIPFHRAKPNEVGECAICLSSIDIGNFVIDLQCLHKFHSQCIRTWLTTRASCPVCRVPVEHPEFIIEE